MESTLFHSQKGVGILTQSAAKRVYPQLFYRTLCYVETDGIGELQTNSIGVYFPT